MKHSVLLIAGAIVASSAVAQDMEDSSKKIRKEWRNPITKTKHIREKSKEKNAGPQGSDEVEVTKKTTVKKSGETKEHVEIEGDSTKKPE